MARTSFNDHWQFWKEGQTEVKEVDLPHDAMIWEQRDPHCDNAHNSGFYPGSKYYYKKIWNIPNQFAGKRLTLEFEGVYRNAVVLINGKQAAERPSGYTTFYVDCTEYVRYGEENEVLVIADNKDTPNGRWYTGSGIYRPVNLIVKDEHHIHINGVKVKTLSHQPPRIEVRIEHSGGGVVIEVYYKGKLMTRANGDCAVMDIPDGKLWSDETPELYQCKVMLEHNGRIVDEEWVDVGIRTLSWSTDGFLVNGKETKLRGACIHHDNGILGACAFDDAEERRVRLLKKAGFNAIRSSHNPCSRALLQAADKVGMYVMDEFSDVWVVHKQKNDYASDFDKWYMEDLRAMVVRDYNHPSVVMYSIGNEIGEVWEERGIQLTKEMTEVCHRLDDSRPVTCGTNLMLANMAMKGIGVFKVVDVDDKKRPAKPDKKKFKLVASEFYNILINIMGGMMDRQSKKKNCDKATAEHFSHLDICGYNYGTIRYANEPRLHPERIIVGSETRPPNIMENWRATMNNKYIIGDFMWVGWDYLGEAGIGAIAYSSRSPSGWLLKKYPYLLADAGVIDICGWFRPEVWLNRVAWGTIGNNPYIGVEPVTHAKEKVIRSMWRKSDAVHSWSWHGYEGSPAKIVVYSRAKTVELLLNGKSLGKKPIKEGAALFKTKYLPGELVAVNYDANGKELGKNHLRTGGKDIKLTLDPEKTVLRANGQDLCYVNIYLTDGHGEILPATDRSVHVQVSGAGQLLAIGSANPYTEEGFVSGNHQTYYGRALAVIRVGRNAGLIQVTISADGVEDKTIAIDVFDAVEVQYSGIPGDGTLC
ncbi:glycoside hydrolase family 2 TIM barrel-domain containing protein [Paenibacillus sp. GM2]|uniref:glycoside hydrolase family 2 TIM barrel-domain containing protein n=1 Tax=Paenibacillus sp. GM2 TaxID=1622070 RepID=UPI000837EA9F|nr:glycoside hydrolase family 2 TIM barrel-domain containing protein [Paenibacillus sp. GM2]